MIKYLILAIIAVFLFVSCTPEEENIEITVEEPVVEEPRPAELENGNGFELDAETLVETMTESGMARIKTIAVTEQGDECLIEVNGVQEWVKIGLTKRIGGSLVYLADVHIFRAEQDKFICDIVA